MTRIFPVLAAVNGLLLIVSFALGVVSKLRDGIHNPSDQTFLYHFLFGLSAAVFTLLVHCLVFTYFLGTGRWVKEVAIAYRIPDRPWPKATRAFKRSAYPAALFAMLSVIAAVASGAGAQQASESGWGWAHPVLAIVAMALN